MLVLTRKHNETIKIGEDILIKVIQTGRGSVKLGIEAPAHIRVLRGELAEFSTASGAEHCDSHSVSQPQIPLPMTKPRLVSAPFLKEFDAEYVADLEDQLLVCTAS